MSKVIFEKWQDAQIPPLDFEIWSFDCLLKQRPIKLNAVICIFQPATGESRSTYQAEIGVILDNDFS